MVNQQKIDAVENLRKKMESARVIGILDMHKLPSKQYQEINKKLREEVEFLMVRKSTLLRALEATEKKGIKEFEKLVPTQPALVFTNLDPFKFYMRASKMKSPTYAKEGDKAEEEIVVPAGPTGLMPGPVISEFAKVKIPAGVEDGKISIKRETVVAKAGDVISKDLANILRKLKIQPVRVGLKIVAVYDDGTIYMDDVLSLAGQGYIDALVACHQKALNLSVSCGYPTKQNIGLLLAKAYRESQAIGSLIRLDANLSQEVAQPDSKVTEKSSDQVQTEIPKNE
jgi:large subunit ribosomal protein L10